MNVLGVRPARVGEPSWVGETLPGGFGVRFQGGAGQTRRRRHVGTWSMAMARSRAGNPVRRHSSIQPWRANSASGKVMRSSSASSGPAPSGWTQPSTLAMKILWRCASKSVRFSPLTCGATSLSPFSPPRPRTFSCPWGSFATNSAGLIKPTFCSSDKSWQDLNLQPCLNCAKRLTSGCGSLRRRDRLARQRPLPRALSLVRTAWSPASP